MSKKFSHQVLVATALSVLLGGCQGLNGSSKQARSIASSMHPVECSADIQAFRRTVESEGVADAGAPAIEYFPLLHNNRFLSTLSRAVNSDVESVEWASLSAELAIDTRAIENKNLSSPWSDTSLSALAACSRNVASADLYEKIRNEILAAERLSPFSDHYSKPRQALGALPLLRPFLRQRILALHTEERDWFEEDENYTNSIGYKAAVDGGAPRETSSWMQTAYASNELDLPLLEDWQVDALFAQHAPSLQIAFTGDNDKIGEPQWQGDNISINTDDPVAYTLTSMTQFEGANLLQLNYVFWFPERKARAAIDLYSGNVDSLIWRVTLDREGQVLLYDSIHSCGCYHKYFVASESLAAREQPSSKEPANIFNLSQLNTQRGLSLTISANEHYIVGANSASREPEQDTQLYELSPYQSLQNLSSSSGPRSLFDDRGLIPGSERLERFTLWPTGIDSVGAMRQWGTHATGFIEDQHFDDADLFDKYFESTQ